VTPSIAQAATDAAARAFDAWQAMWKRLNVELSVSREQAAQAPVALHIGEIVAIRRRLLSRGTTWPTSSFLPSDLLAGARPDIAGVAEAAAGVAAWRLAPLTVLVDAEWEADQPEPSIVTARDTWALWIGRGDDGMFVWQDRDVLRGRRHSSGLTVTDVSSGDVEFARRVFTARDVERIPTTASGVVIAVGAHGRPRDHSPIACSDRCGVDRPATHGTSVTRSPVRSGVISADVIRRRRRGPRPAARQMRWRAAVPLETAMASAAPV